MGLPETEREEGGEEGVWRYRRRRQRRRACVFLKPLGPSPGPHECVGVPTRDTGAAQVAPRRRVWG